MLVIYIGCEKYKGDKCVPQPLGQQLCLVNLGHDLIRPSYLNVVRLQRLSPSSGRKAEIKKSRVALYKCNFVFLF